MSAEQLQLAPVHDNDPVESLLAAQKVDAADQFRKVMYALYNAEKPLTDDELGERCGLLRHAAGTRRGVARNMGYVEKAGRGVSALGNPCGTWRLTGTGRRWVVEQMARRTK